MNRLIIVPVSSCLLHRWLSEGTRGFRVIKGGLPEDAVLVSVHSDGRTVSFTYQSESFPEVPPEAPIPSRLITLESPPIPFTG